MKKTLKVILPVVVTALGVGALMTLVKTRPEPPRRPTSQEGLLVETQPLRAGDHEVHVEAQGVVAPAQQVVLSAEVGGRVRWQSDELVPGGRFSKGATLLRIDPRDYQLQVEARSADVNRASLELQLERGRQRVAEREWEAFGTETPNEEEGRELALRRPQVETAQTAVRSAQSAVQQARLNLTKTTMTAPFNSMVVNENVDVGQLVGPTSQLATLVGTDEFWVRVSIPVENLSAIRLPRGDEPGSRARVWQQIGAQRVERAGHVIRLLPDIDPVGAMARVLIAIDDPMALGEENAGSLPMLLGSYVTVEIDAAPLTDVVAVPRRAVREGDRAFVMHDGRLSIRELSVVWRSEDTVYASAGVRDGEALIVSRVATPVEGMMVRVAEARDERRAEAPSEEPSDDAPHEDDPPGAATP